MLFFARSTNQFGKPFITTDIELSTKKEFLTRTENQEIQKLCISTAIAYKENEKILLHDFVFPT